MSNNELISYTNLNMSLEEAARFFFDKHIFEEKYSEHEKIANTVPGTLNHWDTLVQFINWTYMRVGHTPDKDADIEPHREIWLFVTRKLDFGHIPEIDWRLFLRESEHIAIYQRVSELRKQEFWLAFRDTAEQHCLTAMQMDRIEDYVWPLIHSRKKEWDATSTGYDRMAIDLESSGSGVSGWLLVHPNDHDWFTVEGITTSKVVLCAWRDKDHSIYESIQASGVADRLT